MYCPPVPRRGHRAAALLLLAGLQLIPGDVYEASTVDGASKVQQFFQITLPLLTPVVFFNAIIQTIEAFKKISEGEYDHFPEQAFFMCGGLEDLERQAHELMKG